jgi:hypothetical protein
MKTMLISGVITRTSEPIYFHRELGLPKWGRRLFLIYGHQEIGVNVSEEEFQNWTRAADKFGEVLDPE